MSHLEANPVDAQWRHEQLSATEARWAEDQRALRTHLITTDKLDFVWTPPAAAVASSSNSSSSDIDESKSDSEAGSISPHHGSTVPLKYIGGVDISFVGNGDEGDSDDACAALIVVEYPSMTVAYEDFEMVKMSEPYIAGFLAFREVDHLLQLLNRLRARSPHLLPQLLMVDGNGILHHRGFGLASHLGVLANLPTIGIGKNLLLIDGLDRSVVQQRAQEELKDGGESFDLVGESGQTWGACLRSTRASTNPIYVSIGHRISLPTAVSIVASCCSNRIPTPVRLADLTSREFIRKWKVANPIAAAAGRAAAAAWASSSRAAAAASSVDSSAGVPAVAASSASVSSSTVASPTSSSSAISESKQDAECTARLGEKRRMSAPLISPALPPPPDSGGTRSPSPAPTLEPTQMQRQWSDPTSAGGGDGTRSATVSGSDSTDAPRQLRRTHSDASADAIRKGGTQVPTERTPACVIS